jgi:hypothetical protein
MSDEAKRMFEGAVPMAGQELLEGAEQLARNANDALNGLADAAGLTPKVQKNPYGLVAAALGIGYVVGGGLFTPTTARLIRLGMKLAAIPLVRDRMLDLAESAVDGMLSHPAAPPPPNGSEK